ncbi:hypothetical protein EON79_00270 [bacterium]|nr:MAG: hypothetical protein EON79_00270 [bacterium]
MKQFTLALLAGVAAVASAQGSKTVGDTYPYGISVRAGVVFPIERSFSDFYSPTLLGLGVDYTFNRPLFKGGETFFSLDFFTSQIGRKGNVVPFMINQRFYSNARELGSRTYAFVGLGVVFRDTPNNDSTLGGRVGAGLELSNNVFTEATLFLSSKRSGIGSNGIGLYAGYRF